VLADLVDRRRLLIAAQGATAAGVASLATLTGAGLATPTVLPVTPRAAPRPCRSQP